MLFCNFTYFCNTNTIKTDSKDSEDNVILCSIPPNGSVKCPRQCCDGFIVQIVGQHEQQSHGASTFRLR